MSITSFSELELRPEILSAISEMGFEATTPIQSQCILPILEGRDLVGQAQTGTGKTAAFGAPVVSKVDASIKGVQALIQCPTRELAIQVTGELMKIARNIPGLSIVPVYGGQPISRQLTALKRGAQIVVGTPGRTIDHLKRGTIKLGNLQMLVFDEADEMLNMGFREDMEEILSYTDAKIQTVMFSATVPRAIRDIMNRYMTEPVNVKTQSKNISAPDISQYVVEVRDSVRTEAISRLMDVHQFKLGLVFSNTKKQTEQIARDLQARGYTTEVINGNLGQVQRDRVMNRFRKGEIDLLVATDVAARGIDVDGIDVVFNYEIPQDPEYYVHRIGRTGRAGRSGTSITFTAGRKNRRLHFIEKQIGRRLDPLAMPSTADVQESRMAGQMEELENELAKGGLKPFIEQIEVMAEGDYTSTEIAAALLKMRMSSSKTQNGKKEAGRTVEHHEAPGAKANGHRANGHKANGHKANGHHKNGAPSGGPSGGGEAGMNRLHFSVGKNHHVHSRDLVGAIAGESGIPGNVIGSITLREDFSWVDVPGEYAEQVIQAMNQSRIKGNRVMVTAD